MQDASVAPRSNRMPVKQWPLKFDSHKFSLVTYDTYGVRVEYRGPPLQDAPDELQRSSASYGPDYQRNWGGGHLMIPNFPPPAKVSWRSKDGQAHEAEIDLGEIFADETIRHNVNREEMADVHDGEYKEDPSIILEVNDRTIRVWMRAMIFLKKQVEIGGVKRSAFKNDLMLVKSYVY